MYFFITFATYIIHFKPKNMESIKVLIKRLLLYAALWLGSVLLAAIIMIASGLYNKEQCHCHAFTGRLVGCC